MAEHRTYRTLLAWQQAMELVLIAYPLAARLPAIEKYELASQIRRAVTAIPANIAEGRERRGKGYLHHVRIAIGSLAELETHIEVAILLQYLESKEIEPFLQKSASVRQLLYGLRRSLYVRLLQKGVTATGCLLAFLALLQ